MSPYTRLSQDEASSSAQGESPSSPARLAKLRIYWLTAVICCGGILFGYDSGVIGGVLIFDSFLRDFKYTADEQTRVSSIAVGIQQAGALVGCLAIWPLTNRLGRRCAMMICSAIFCAGVVFEVLNSHALSVFYFGRVICGLGIGGSATVIPIYLSEMSPKDMRARLGSCYQFTFTVGILISYWIDYGVQFSAPTAAQWQVPLALQLVPGALMGLGMLTLDESVRWLLAHDDPRRAWSSLVWIRASNGPDVVAEFAEMKQSLDADRHAMDGFHPRELLQWRNTRRLALGITLFLAQQSTGATAMAYFGPQFFALLVGQNNASLTLLLTGIFGALKVASCFIFIVWIAERFGRRPLLILGALGMSFCMLATAAVVKNDHTQPLPASASSSAIKPTGVATIALIYLDIVFYNFSWGPLIWPCTSELFSSRIREPGVAIAVAAQWLSNFAWSFSTPYILAGLGWATFLLFGLLDLLFSGFVGACLPETAGKSLEEIEAVLDSAGSFGSSAGHQRLVVEEGEGEGEDEREEGESAPLNGKGSSSSSRDRVWA
ncbi:putative MFS quinate transporter [Aspergillus steynii IBT 23096]|uniref:Putative MFS quinate transporter n=1 Tax=Aspergillus steynii IBT 23096 TaxID=1392250 RepID=A0A2I2FUM6_9EURO|nr:putative MFS quinate transporter [Aspergillus steynii IBT 23096]PLB44343.1 putative MFS quinate transporter [Aspergillus steynii IBT 23096]